MSLLERNDTLFLVIDMQEKLMKVMTNVEDLEASAIRLIKGARILNIPILVTQQYTAGIGATTTPLKEALGDFSHIEKNTFSCMETEDFRKALAHQGKNTIIVCGIESHICVQQTVLQLLDNHYHVCVAEDCVSSRKKGDLTRSLLRMEKSGAIISTGEAILFELLKTSKAAEFKDISKLVK